MDWPKVKTLLILLFAAINLILLGNIYSLEWQKFRVDSQVIEGAIAVLENNGVSIDQELINPQREVMEEADLRFTGEEKQNAALRLLDTQADQLEMVPGEDVSAAVYRTAQGTLTLWDDCSVEFVSAQGWAGEDFQQAARLVGDRLSGTDLGMEWMPMEHTEEGETRFSLQQTWQDIPIEGCELEVTVSADGTVQATGRWICGQMVPTETGSITDSVSSLLLYPVYRTSSGSITIETVEPVYVPQISVTGSSLQPCYHIEDDRGGEMWIQAFTGEQIQ
ncbi:MAG: hypothetical protein ACOX7F_01335 [Eubacteriales bacterium]|jgi:hypothetical protein